MRSKFVSYVVGAAFVGLVPSGVWAQPAGTSSSVTVTPDSVTASPSPSATQPPPLAPVDTYGDTTNRRAAGNASVGNVGSNGNTSGTTTTTGTDNAPGAGAGAQVGASPSGVGASAGVGAGAGSDSGTVGATSDVGTSGNTSGATSTTTSPGVGAPAAEPRAAGDQTIAPRTDVNINVTPTPTPAPTSTAGSGIDNMVSPTTSAPSPTPAPPATVAPSPTDTYVSPAPTYSDNSTELRAGPGVAREELYSRGPRSGFGTALAVGGGISNFVGSTARAQTDVGGSWAANLTLGTRAPLALELGYIGGANGLNVSGLDPDALMLRNGGQAALRLNGRVVSGWSMIEPFAFVGGAWQRLSIVNDAFNRSAVRGADDVFSVPFGGGLATAYRGFYLEGRFTYRPTFDENFFGGADLTSWNAGVNLGAEF